ncbi:HAMP domain-containing sensor histidine kinase [Desulfosporosinus sp. OT]|uniref:sensor histidine kinase n=1 Tax=Desulfosporosinus sp. OT TaxID=913865 RepID=UPI001FA7E187|nr:HAMP domain-containing sensor histidine kinase [Desulfosporosinus sp. OT]
MSYKKSTLIESSAKLADLIVGKSTSSDFNDENLIYQISTIEKSIGGTIFIGTIDGKLFYPQQNGRGFPQRPVFMTDPTFNLRNKSDTPPPKSWLRSFGQSKRGVKDWEQYDANSFFFITQDTNFKIDTLSYQTKLANNVLILVWIPMTGISESAAISNKFTAIIGLITIFITALWALYISGRFTHPIAEMNRITKKMAELDFSQVLKIDRKDEIGQLSQSINHLSYNLDDAINELNCRNRLLEQDIERERKLDNMRRKFISNVSHELKTPIFLIQGYADGLKSNVVSDEEKRNFYCDVIMEESEKMDNLVKDLLDLSQIESGIFPVNKTNFNVKLIINDTISKYEPILSEKNIHLNVDMEEDLEVNADPVRIEQIIVNLMTNAIDHAEGDKVIKLSVKPTAEKVRVSVFNTGRAIPDDALDKIWSSFYKIDQARTRGFGGTGLGLSIVRAIQEAHANEYGVSNVENGVEFWFDICWGQR